MTCHSVCRSSTWTSHSLWFFFDYQRCLPKVPLRASLNYFNWPMWHSVANSFITSSPLLPNWKIGWSSILLKFSTSNLGFSQLIFDCWTLCRSVYWILPLHSLVHTLHTLAREVAAEIAIKLDNTLTSLWVFMFWFLVLIYKTPYIYLKSLKWCHIKIMFTKGS